MSDWKLLAEICSTNAVAMAASMASESETEIIDERLIFRLKEEAANDLRAMWNTRMRSLQAVESVLLVIEGQDS